jgi:hypothetical protein
MKSTLLEYLSALAHKERLRASRTKDWKKYQKDVDEFMEYFPLGLHAMPGSYLMALRYVKAARRR